MDSFGQSYELELEASKELLEKSGLDFSQKGHQILAFLRRFIEKESRIKQQNTFFIFDHLIQKFSQYQQKPFVCGRNLQPSDGHKTIKVYRCEDCGQEKNSVICKECFEPEKHKGHNYQLLDVVGGYCDCGDNFKLKEEGFCCIHKFDRKKEAQKKIEEIDRSYFLDFCTQMTWALCCFYNCIQKNSKNLIKTAEVSRENIVLKHMIRKVDFLGEGFFLALLQINKDRYSLNNLSRDWLKQQITYHQTLTYVRSKNTQEQLMKFVDLPKTAKTSATFFITLCVQGAKYREEVTKLYFTLYSGIPYYNTSSYRELSAQMLANYKIINRICKVDKVKPITISSFVEETLQKKELQEQVKRFGESYSNYFQDLEYLLELKEEFAYAYWKYFEETCGIQELFSYAKYLNHSSVDIINLAHKMTYEIQETCLTTYVQIAQLIRESDFVKKTIKVLFSSEKVFIKSLFLPEYQVLSLFLFLFFFKELGVVSFSKVTLSHLKSLLQILGLTKSEFEEHLMAIFKQLIYYFRKISVAMSSNQNIQANMSFGMTYFKSLGHPNFLFSLDAFLFRFVINSFLLLNSEDEKKYEETERRLSYCLQQELKDLNWEFQNKYKQYMVWSQRLKVHTNENVLVDKQRKFQDIQQCVLTFHNFVNLINESIHSSLPELVLLSHFPSLLQSNMTSFKGFYRKILRIMKATNDKVPLVDFRKLVRFLFFKEDIIFEKFIEEHRLKEENESLKAVVDGPVNLEHYYSLRFKLSVAKVESMIVKPSFTLTPFDDKELKGSNLFWMTSYLSIVKNWLTTLVLMKQSQNSLINDVTKELYRMSKVSCHKLSLEIQKYFYEGFIFLQVDKNLNNAGRSLSVFSYLNRDVDNLLQGYKKNLRDISNSELKEESEGIPSSDFKLHEANLEDQNQRNVQSSLTKNQSSSKRLFFDDSCAFGENCSEKGKEIPLYWFTYVSQTNMNSMFSISPQERIFTFYSCGHCSHRSCFQKLKEEMPVCKRCKARVNFLMVPTNRLVNQPKAKELINKELQELSLLFKCQRKMEVELYRSLNLFLSLFFILTDFSRIYNHIVVYQSLFAKLKILEVGVLLNHQTRAIQTTSSIGEWVDKVKVIDLCLIKKQCPSVNLLKNQHELLKKYQIENENLEKVIKFLGEDTNLWTVSPFSLQDQKTNLIKHFVPQTFGSTLKQLGEKRQCSLCSSNKEINYFICIIPHHDQKSCCFCQQCYLKSRHQHIFTSHFNQSLFIETDSGKPYFHLIPEQSPLELNSNNVKVLSYDNESLYQNSLGAPYLKGKQYKKEEFYLSQHKLGDLLSNFCTWSLSPFSK